MQIDETLFHILDAYNVSRKNKKKILANTFDEGEDKEDLETQNVKAAYLIKGHIAILRKLGSDLFSYVGSKKLDMTEILTEDKYNEKIEDIIRKLKEIGQSLY